MVTSPRNLNPLNHLVESNVGTSRNSIKADLVRKIVYDDSSVVSVFRRSRVDQISDNFVPTCTASFKAANANGINGLKELEERASQKLPGDLEIDEANDKAGDLNEERSGNHGSAEEKKMYDPLVRGVLNNFFFSSEISTF